MGDYTGYSYSIKFKEDANTDVLSIFKDTLPDDDTYAPTVLRILKTYDISWTLDEVHDVLMTINSGSAYFKAWQTGPKFDTETNTFTSYASCLAYEQRQRVALKLMMSLRSNIVLELDRIYVRSIYENDSQEKVIWYDRGLGIMESSPGFKYYYDFSPLEDYRHPRSYEADDAPDTFVPPSNYRELVKLNEHNLKTLDRQYGTIDPRLGKRGVG